MLKSVIVNRQKYQLIGLKNKEQQLEMTELYVCPKCKSYYWNSHMCKKYMPVKVNFKKLLKCYKCNKYVLHSDMVFEKGMCKWCVADKEGFAHLNEPMSMEDYFYLGD
jgi:ribosomal protein L32